MSQRPAPSLIDTLSDLLFNTPKTCRVVLDRRLRPFGFSQPRWLVLVHLGRAGRAVTQVELAKSMGVEPPTLVPVLDRLEAEGWLARVSCGEDRRCKRVALTAKGEAVAEELLGVAGALRVELMGDIPEEDMRVCIRVLECIAANAERLWERELDASPATPGAQERSAGGKVQSGEESAGTARRR